MQNPFRYFNSSPEVIRLAVMMYVRYPLSLRQVEDLLFERGIDICHETVRFWWNRFGPMFAAEIRKRRVHHRSYSHWRWHPDEVFVRINGKTHYLWRAVDHEGDCDGPAEILPSGHESHWNGGPSAVWTLTQQSGRELTPAVPTTRGRDGALQGHRDPAEIRLRSRLNPQSIQPGPSSQPP